MVQEASSFLITGPRGAGKSTLCLEILRYIQACEFSVGGVITIQDTERWFYLIQSDKKVQFEAEIHEPSISVGKFRINSNNLNQATQHIMNGRDSDFLFIDEVGILEMNGKGYFSVLETALKRPQGNIIVVRESIFDDFISKFNLQFEYIVLKCRFGKNQRLLDDVIRKIDKNLMND